MSGIFHKSCYTTRSSGYKYRTLSTNTGNKTRRDSREDSTFDRKFKELQREIAWRIDKQVNLAQQARDSIKEKLEMIDSKINLMLELQNTVMSLKKKLQMAESSIAEMAQKVEYIDSATPKSDTVTLQSRLSSIKSQATIEKGEET